MVWRVITLWDVGRRSSSINNARLKIVSIWGLISMGPSDLNQGWPVFLTDWPRQDKATQGFSKVFSSIMAFQLFSSRHPFTVFKARILFELSSIRQIVVSWIFGNIYAWPYARFLLKLVCRRYTVSNELPLFKREVHCCEGLTCYIAIIVV